MSLKFRNIIIIGSLFFTILSINCATTPTKNNQDYLSLFFEQNENKKEILMIDIERIVEEFALIINDQNLKFKKGEKLEIIRNDEPIGLVNVIQIDGKKVVVKATLDNQNDVILPTDKIQYIID